MAYENKFRLEVNCVIGLFFFSCLIGNLSCKRSHLPPIGKELSDINGISIARIHDSYSSSSSSGGGMNEAYLNSNRIDLVSCIGRASNNQDPIFLLTELPPGQYSISAQVNRGGRPELTKRICYVFSKAFDCRVTRRMIEADVVVITCPDPNSLKLTKQAPSQSRGFYKHVELGNNTRRTHFAATLDQLAWFAGRMSRITAPPNNIENRKQSLKIAYVNETHIEGIFAGAIDWNSLDPGMIKSSLENMGIKLTTERRSIPAIVIEPHVEGQQWSYLNEKGEIEIFNPNTRIDNTR